MAKRILLFPIGVITNFEGVFPLQTHYEHKPVVWDAIITEAHPVSYGANMVMQITFETTGAPRPRVPVS